MSDESTPVLRILTPDATDEEVAALVAVLAALDSAAGPPPRARRTPSWNAPARLVRRPVNPGPGGWRSSGLPR